MEKFVKFGTLLLGVLIMLTMGYFVGIWREIPNMQQSIQYGVSSAEQAPSTPTPTAPPRR